MHRLHRAITWSTSAEMYLDILNTMGMEMDPKLAKYPLSRARTELGGVLRSMDYLNGRATSNPDNPLVTFSNYFESVRAQTIAIRERLDRAAHKV